MFILKILIYIAISTVIISFIYNIIYLIYYNSKIKNDKLKIKYEVISNKVRKNKYMSKLSHYIFELKKLDNKKYRFISKSFIILISIILSVITFFVSYYIFDIYSTAVLISLISFGIPYFVIEQLYLSQKQKIVDNFPMYILTLKNYVYSTNDVILAFRKANVPNYLFTYINKFNISIEKGISVVQAFEQLKKDINIEVISDFLSSLLTCHLNGGNVCILLNKYAEMLTKINQRNAKMKQENLSSVIIFFILLVINFFLLFIFVYTNIEYKEIMTTNLVGKSIINFNILSYIFIFLLYKRVNRNI